MRKKTTVCIFQVTNCCDSTQEDLIMATKRKLKGEIKSLLIAIQNNTINTNYIEGKIDNMQQNIKCRLCRVKDEMVKHIISEYSKLVQKEYKTRHD